jgi:hypothetical protein
MMNKLVCFVLAITASVVVYRYRYRIVNAILRVRLLQQWLVRLAMNIPFVRNTIISQVFR